MGTPGTIIEIVNGNVVVDFREFLKTNPKYKSEKHLKASISEVSLIFKLDISKIQDRMREYQQKALY